MITHVAIKCRGAVFHLPSPARHVHVLALAIASQGWPEIGGDTYGFLDHMGNFLTRVEALAHAHACQQECRTPPGAVSGLYSEDIW